VKHDKQYMGTTTNEEMLNEIKQKIYLDEGTYHPAV
jgi:hypothetical protein